MAARREFFFPTIHDHACIRRWQSESDQERRAAPETGLRTIQLADDG
jgi:hypothetical protein